MCSQGNSSSVLGVILESGERDQADNWSCVNFTLDKDFCCSDTSILARHSLDDSADGPLSSGELWINYQADGIHSQVS